MGYENWQAPPSLRLAIRPAPPSQAEVESPSLRRRLAMMVGLGIASWAVLIGGARAVAWVFESFGPGG